MPRSKVPREKIPWYPTVDREACIGDQECYNFCKNDVFRWDEAEDRPSVVNPYRCVVGCSACAQLCPTGAIHFPTLEELREAMRRAAGESPAGQRPMMPALPVTP